MPDIVEIFTDGACRGNPGPGGWAALLRYKGREKTLHGAEPMEDAFEDWGGEEFFLAFVNGKVGLIVACGDARHLEQESGKLLSVMVDRLLRLNPAWRLDEKGRGIFAGRPRLDTVAIGRSAASD